MVISGNLTLSTPDNRVVTVTNVGDTALEIRSSDVKAFRQLIALRRSLPIKDWGLPRFLRLQHPLSQTIFVFAGDRLLLEWPPDSRPRPRVQNLLRFLLGSLR